MLLNLKLISIISSYIDENLVAKVDFRLELFQNPYKLTNDSLLISKLNQLLAFQPFQLG